MDENKNYQDGYQQQNDSNYQQPNSDSNSGGSYYQQPNNGGGYYQQPNNGGGYYQQPNNGGGYYQQPNNGGYYQQPRETKFCSNCGQTIDKQAVICPMCGCQVSQMANNTPAPAPAPQIVINNSNNNVANAGVVGVGANPRNKWVAFMLCLFLGWLGVHKFYEGKPIMGVLYLFTAGLFGFGIVIDLIVILCRPNPYYV